MILVLEKGVPFCAASSHMNWFSLSVGEFGRTHQTLKYLISLPSHSGIYVKGTTKDALEDLEMSDKIMVYPYSGILYSIKSEVTEIHLC